MMRLTAEGVREEGDCDFAKGRPRIQRRRSARKGGDRDNAPSDSSWNTLKRAVLSFK
jgi:hypothetical protein